jgi:phage shock protein C
MKEVFMTEENEQQYSSDENLFDRMANSQPVPSGKKFQRSRSNVILAGVCSGLADYFNVDRANIRLIAMLSLMLGGWGAVAYLVTAILMPAEKNPQRLNDEEKKLQQKENFRTVLSGLLMLTGFHFAFIYIGIGNGERLFILPNGFIFSLAVFIIGILLLTNIFSVSEDIETEPPTDYERSRKDRRFLGVCGGFSRYLNIDASGLRIIFLLAALLTLGLFGIIYFMLGIFIRPEMEQKFE